MYDFLEGRFPHASYTYTKLAEITEQEEKEKINFEIGQRRTRLGARIDQVIADVKSEVLQASTLESVYQGIIDWTNDDETRRLFEEKLLQHAYDTLLAVPAPQKEEKREQVLKLAKGLVILKHPFSLAWSLTLEWTDVEHLKDLDAGILREYVEFFPEDGLSKVLQGYLDSDISVFPNQLNHQREVVEAADSQLMTSEDRLLLMTEGVEDTSSVLACRVMGEYYLHLDEFESATEIAQKAHRQLAIESRSSGLPLTENFDAVSVILGTALVQHQAPRHHPEARSIFEALLQRKPANTSALIGIGLILEEQENYKDATDFLHRALKQIPDTKVKAEAAWCRALDGDFQSCLTELEQCLPELKETDRRTKNLKSQILYRIGICIWNLDSSKAARKNRDGAYAHFLESLQADLNFAPAYTSLGFYYADYAKDQKRARKCFQKAFELSSSEVEAAERLARSFAKSSEWDLVEVVAQRVIDSGKVRPAPGSKKKGISWPFTALGVVELNKSEYAKGIVSFQLALRISPEDYYSWVGLGECYHNSGRYIAATKAFEQAQKLEQGVGSENYGDTWFSKYMLANVKRELGEYDVAIDGYREVLASRTSEYGVSIASLQTSIESAWHSIELGFFGRAVNSLHEALATAQDIANWHNDSFSLWKAVGDLCSVYTYVQSYANEFPIGEIRRLLESRSVFEEYDLLADYDGIGQSALEKLDIEGDANSLPAACCFAAVLAHKRAIACCAHDQYARAVAWYNLGWAEHRTHTCCRNSSIAGSQNAPVKYLKTSIQCFKKAIESEASNSEFWNSLGVVTSQLSPKVSQHSFVRSLFLNEKSARVWTNLGTLYLIQNDVQLANDAFTRAQSADPGYAPAWLGQGLIADVLGETTEARNLFTHASEIADSSASLIQRKYASSMLDHLLSSPVTSARTTSLLQPLFALRQLGKSSLTDLPFEQIQCLFQERIGDYAAASETLSSICSKLEIEYETSESPQTLARFAQAKADLSRAQLAQQDFDSAAENADTALDLSADEELSSPQRKRTRLSAHLSGGLANYYKKSMDRSIEMFRNALEETEGDPDIVCLLAQVLWAKGGGQERSVAREQLFNCVEKNPDHVEAIMLLGVIAILDEDRDTVETVVEDLQTLRAREDLSPDQRDKLAQLLSAIAKLCPAEEGRGASQISEAATTVMLAPSQPYGWNQLAGLSDETYPADMAVLTAIKSAPPGGDLTAKDLARAYAGAPGVENAQISIMLAPWTAHGWSALA